MARNSRPREFGVLQGCKNRGVGPAKNEVLNADKLEESFFISALSKARVRNCSSVQFWQSFSRICLTESHKRHPKLSFGRLGHAVYVKQAKCAST
jgi:hypothetical protein